MIRRAVRLSMIASVTLALGYLAICLAFMGLERQLLYPGPDYTFRVFDGSERVVVPDGTFFLWRPVPGDGPVVVHFHSNADQVMSQSSMGMEWSRIGVSFAAVEYPGFAGAPGVPSEESITLAAEAALRHLTGPMQIDRSRIVLTGQSLGAAVALKMADRGWGQRLVLISPFTSQLAVTEEAFPYLPMRYLQRDRFDSEAIAARIKVPTLVIHGASDSTVPLAQGERITSLIPGARLLTIPGGEHDDVLDLGVAQRELLSFVRLPHASR